jgi:hypothetical protein
MSSGEDVPSAKKGRTGPEQGKHKQQKYRSKWEEDERFKKWLEPDVSKECF